jgi:hypothetical protein
MKSLMPVLFSPSKASAPKTQGWSTGSCRLGASALEFSSWQRTCSCTSYLPHHSLALTPITLPVFFRIPPRSLLARRPRQDETSQKGQSALICGQVHAS